MSILNLLDHKISSVERDNMTISKTLREDNELELENLKLIYLSVYLHIVSSLLHIWFFFLKKNIKN